MLNKNLELFFEINRCVELFNTNIFYNDSPFTQSAFIEILIRLNNILQALPNDKKIQWSDDIEITDKITNITDLINALRNAACHINSPENYTTDDSETKFVFNSIAGKNPKAFCIKGIYLGCDYEDDVAFYYGDKRIYK